MLYATDVKRTINLNFNIPLKNEDRYNNIRLNVGMHLGRG